MSTQPGPGPAEWSGWYEDYLTRAAGQSARAAELYQEVMARVSRGELSATVMQDLLPAFVQARGSAYSADMAQLSMRFFGGLVRLSSVQAAELIGSLSPGLAPPSPGAPPPLRGDDWGTWFQQVNEYATAHGAATISAYQELLDRVAAGDIAPGQVQQTSARYLEQRSPEHLRQLMSLCFELLNGLNDVRTHYSEEFLEGMLGAVRPDDEPALFALELAAPLGDTASARLSLTNTREQPSVVRCAASEVRRADGVGPAFPSGITVEPEPVDLAPGEEAELAVSLRLGADRFEAGPLYVGELQVTGHGDERLAVPLRIRATAVP